MAYHDERREQLKADQQDLMESLTLSESLLIKDEQSYQDRQNDIETALPQHEACLEALMMAQQVVEEAELNLENYREKVSVISQAILSPTRLAEAEKTKIAHLEKQVQQIQERLKRLEGEYQGLNIEDPVELEELLEKIEEATEQREEYIEKIEALHSHLF